MVQATEHSLQIHSQSLAPQIEETRVDEALAAFDWIAYLENRWDRVEDSPAGTWSGEIHAETRAETRQTVPSLAEGGLRRQNEYGGELNVSQRFTAVDALSQFERPGDQSLGQLRLSYTQPLLRGAGSTYNRSQVLVAELNADAAQDRFLQGLQHHLLRVTESYWRLYEARVLCHQQQELICRTADVVDQMQRRAEKDGALGPASHAKAMMMNRQADLFGAQQAVLDEQERLARLVFGSTPHLGLEREWLPQDIPTIESIFVDPQLAFADAMNYRPEIHAALREIKAAGVENRVATAELLPKLDLVLETYVTGVRWDVGSAGSWNTAFDRGETNYGLALNYEVPLGSRAAEARDRRKQLEMARLESRFTSVVEDVAGEISSAVRAIDTRAREVQTRRDAVEQARDELVFIQGRLDAVPIANESARLYLDNLLGSQQRVARLEADYARAVVAHSLAWVRLKQVTGTLVRFDSRPCSNDRVLNAAQTTTASKRQTNDNKPTVWE